LGHILAKISKWPFKIMNKSQIPVLIGTCADARSASGTAIARAKREDSGPPCQMGAAIARAKREDFGPPCQMGAAIARAKREGVGASYSSREA
jgi:hypothetical protein